MKRILFTCLLATIVFAGKSQEIEAKSWGPEFTYVDKEVYGDVIGKHNESYYVVRNNDGNFSLMIFNEEMKPVMEEGLNRQLQISAGEERALLDIYMRNETIYVVTSNAKTTYDRSFTGTTILENIKIYVQTFNIKTLKSNDDSRLILKTQGVRFNKWIHTDDYSRHAFIIKDNNDRFVAYIFDEDLQKEHEIKIPVIAGSEHIDVSSAVFDNENNFHLVSFSETGEAYYSGTVHSYDDNGRIIKSYNLSTKETRELGYTELSVSSTGQLVLNACFNLHKRRNLYKNHKTSMAYQSSGEYHARIDLQRKRLLYEKFLYYGEDMEDIVEDSDENMNITKSEYRGTADDYGKLRLAPLRNVELPNGLSLSIKYSRRKYDFYYEYRALLITAYSQEGEILWMKKLDFFRTTSRKPGFMNDVALFNNTDKGLYIIYNLQLPSMSIQSDGDGEVMSAFIDMDGTLTIDKIEGTLTEENHFTMQEKASMFVDDKTAVLLMKNFDSEKGSLLEIKFE